MKSNNVIQQANDIIEGDNIVKRMRALFDSLMVESKIIPVLLRPTVNNMVDSFLSSADPAQVTKYIQQVRDQIIPWLLEGDKPDGNTDNQ